jgi:hypothetical protein
VGGDTYDVLLTDFTSYLAPNGFLAELQTELGPAARETYGNLVLAIAEEKPVAWAANVWRNPMHILARAGRCERFRIPTEGDCGHTGPP